MDKYSKQKFRSKNAQSWDQARAMRNNPSMGEAELWKVLRRDQTGVRFRRQCAIGPYILDFYAPSIKLCIEVDGEQHDPSYDARRDRYLSSLGIDTLRIASLDVLDEGARTGAIDVIFVEVQKRLEN